MKRILLITALGMSLAACGAKVSVDNSEAMGVIEPTGGIQETVRPAGEYRLNFCLWRCQRAVVLQLGEDTNTVTGSFILPESNYLDINMTVAVRYRANRDVSQIRQAMTSVQPDDQRRGGTIMSISSDRLYSIYVEPVITDTIRVALQEYSVYQVMENLEEIRTFIESEIKEAVRGTPVEVMRVSISDIQYPETVTESIRAIQQVEFDKQVELAALAADLLILGERREYDITLAGIDTEIDTIYSQHMDAEMATWRMIEVLDRAVAAGIPITIHPAMFPQSAYDLEAE